MHEGGDDLDDLDNLAGFGELFCFGNNRFGALGLAGNENEGPPVVASAPQVEC